MIAKKTDFFVFLDFSYFFHTLKSYIFCTKRKCRVSTFQKCMGLCVFDVYKKYDNSKTDSMSKIMEKNPTLPSPQGVKVTVEKMHEFTDGCADCSAVLRILAF